MDNTLDYNKLISGDKALIASGLGVSIVTVGDTLKKRRGKRRTLLQLKIKQAAEFCMKKNKEKSDYCAKLADINSYIYFSKLKNL